MSYLGSKKDLNDWGCELDITERIEDYSLEPILAEKHFPTD